MELLEEPTGLSDGRVQVAIEEAPERQSAVDTCDRRAFLRLPLSERRRMLTEQADKMIAVYEERSQL